MNKNVRVLTIACVAAMLMAAPAEASECAEGQSEAVLVTKDGSITMCVEDEVLAARKEGVSLALETVECPCASFVPSERSWRGLKDSQSCNVSGDSLVINAMKGGKGKRARSEKWVFSTGGAGNACVYQVYYDGVMHRNSSVLLEDASVADACMVFGSELYAGFAGSKREPGTCQ